MTDTSTPEDLKKLAASYIEEVKRRAKKPFIICNALPYGDKQQTCAKVKYRHSGEVMRFSSHKLAQDLIEVGQMNNCFVILDDDFPERCSSEIFFQAMLKALNKDIELRESEND